MGAFLMSIFPDKLDADGAQAYRDALLTREKLDGVVAQILSAEPKLTVFIDPFGPYLGQSIVTGFGDG
jgi:hypothetical protein